MSVYPLETLAMPFEIHESPRRRLGARMSELSTLLRLEGEAAGRFRDEAQKRGISHRSLAAHLMTEVLCPDD